MSRFYGSLRGTGRTEATRRGTENAPTTAHVRGWDIGVRVVARADGESDVFDVYATFGSNGNGADMFICTVEPGADGNPVATSEYPAKLGRSALARIAGEAMPRTAWDRVS